MEIWKPIKNYEDLYQISNLGNVKSLGRTILKRGVKQVLKGKILKNNININTGYHYVVLYKDKKNKKFLVHRLVAEAFIPNPENKPQVNHINGIRDYNHYLNLEWTTQKENVNHAYDIGLNNCRKSIEQLTLDDVIVSKFDSITEASHFIKNDRSAMGNISACCKGDRKTAYGFKWRYEMKVTREPILYHGGK